MTHANDNLGITFQKAKGWKKCVGFYDHADGRRLPKIHWLGHDREHALFLAFTLAKAWRQMQSHGPRGWKQEDLARVKAFVAGCTDLFREAVKRIECQRNELDHREEFLNAGASFVVPVGSSTTTLASVSPEAQKPSVPTLYSGIQAYLDSLKARRVSEAHKERAIQVLEVNLKRAREDCPLAVVDFAWLETLANHFKNRPTSLKEDGKKISANTAALLLRYLRAFFAWLDDARWGGWEGPRKLSKIFRCSVMEMMTSVELREARTIPQFDLDALCKLYKAGNSFIRRCMLLGLFAGATQQELAVLEKCEFDLDANTLHHFRNKTGAEGRYWLPPEVISLLREDFDKRANDKLAFRVPDGRALIVFKNNKKTYDAVGKAWNDLREEAKLPHARSFKFLRKFLADWMTRNGGDEMGKVALSHARNTVLARNYTTARQFTQFNELQKQMYNELRAAGVFADG